MKLFQPNSFCHRFIVFAGLLLLCSILASSASAATCKFPSPPTVDYSGSSSTPDQINYSIQATSDNPGVESDILTLVITYYDANKVIMGAPHEYQEGSASDTCPVNGSRSFLVYGTSLTLANMPQAAYKATYHYNIVATVHITGNSAAVSGTTANSIEHTVIDTAPIDGGAGNA